jgi:hypothetical protein
VGFLAVVSIRLLPLDDSLTNLTASLQGRQKSSLTWICDMHSHRYDTLRFHRKNSKLSVHRVFVRFRFLSFFPIKIISGKKIKTHCRACRRAHFVTHCDFTEKIHSYSTRQFFKNILEFVTCDTLRSHRNKFNAILRANFF